MAEAWVQSQGESMKRTAILTMLALATFASAQPPAAPSQSTPPGSSQQPPAQGAQPQSKRPPQAKTQPEFDAYKAAVANTSDAAALEKAADDFAAKYPDSELRVLLYENAMRVYQSANNADKMMDMGRKVLKLDPDMPEALEGVAQVLAERTRETDLDKDQRLDEATKLAQHALESIDNVAVPAGTTQDKVDAYKGFLRSNAYYVLGTVNYNREKFADAENNFRKSIDAYPQQPDPLAVLRLALSLDKQGKYSDALKFANQAVDLTQDSTTLGHLARNERDRLIQLTGGTVPAPNTKPPAGGQNPGAPKN
jgi:tetratricopeptide (TPR) repeat protein